MVGVVTRVVGWVTARRRRGLVDRLTHAVGRVAGIRRTLSVGRAGHAGTAVEEPIRVGARERLAGVQGNHTVTRERILGWTRDAVHALVADAGGGRCIPGVRLFRHRVLRTGACGGVERRAFVHSARVGELEIIGKVAVRTAYRKVEEGRVIKWIAVWILRHLVDLDDAWDRNRDSGQLPAIALGGRAGRGLDRAGASVSRFLGGILSPTQAGVDIQVAVAIGIDASDFNVVDT